MCEWKNFETVNPWTVIQPASSSPGSLPKKDADERATGGYVSVKKIPGSSTFGKLFFYHVSTFTNDSFFTYFLVSLLSLAKPSN